MEMRQMTQIIKVTFKHINIDANIHKAAVHSMHYICLWIKPGYTVRPQIYNNKFLHINI